MKTKGRAKLIILIFLFGLALASCTQPLQSLSDRLPGTWQSENATRVYDFDSSGACTLTIPVAEVGVIASPPAWGASAQYSVGAYIVPTSGAQEVFICTTAGVSGSSEPTWNSAGTTNETSAGGTAVWTASATYTERGSWSISGAMVTFAWTYRQPSSESFYISDLAAGKIRLTPQTSAPSLDLSRL